LLLGFLGLSLLSNFNAIFVEKGKAKREGGGRGRGEKRGEKKTKK
jgi:hypothetical protein